MASVYLIYLVPLTIKKKVCRCFTETETHSLNPQVSTVEHKDKEKLPINRRKPWVGPGLQGGTIVQKASRVKGGEKEANRTEEIQE